MTGKKITRKDFIKTGSAGLSALLLQTALPENAARGAGDRTQSQRDRPNILFITMDQLRSLPDIPEKLPLPSLRKLQRESRTFSNYYVHQAPCGPSRSTFYTGQHIQTETHKARILQLNAKVNALVGAEIGVDDGSMYPGGASQHSLG